MDQIKEIVELIAPVVKKPTGQEKWVLPKQIQKQTKIGVYFSWFFFIWEQRTYIAPI